MGKLIYILLFLVVVLASNAQEPDDLYCRGVASIQMGKYDEAVNYLTSAINLNPNNARLYLQRGEAYYNLGLLDNALNDFHETYKLDENLVDFWLSKTYARLGNEEKSLFYLRNHLKSRYHLKEKIIKKDSAFDNIQYSNGWYALWQEDWYTQEEKTEEEIDYLLKKEQYFDAVALLDEKISESKDPYILYACRANVNARLDNYKAAVADMDNAIAVEKKIPEYYIERGIAYTKLGRFSDAVDDFTRMLRQEPAYFFLYLERAKAYARLKEYNLAIS